MNCTVNKEYNTIQYNYNPSATILHDQSEFEPGSGTRQRAVSRNALDHSAIRAGLAITLNEHASSVAKFDFFFKLRFLPLIK